jgi:hypothetical protein
MIMKRSIAAIGIAAAFCLPSLRAQQARPTAAGVTADAE